MLSVRLPKSMEADLNSYCQGSGVTKSHVVQEALAEYLGGAKSARRPAAPTPPDLSFLAPDDPLREFVGVARDGMSTEDLMRLTRGDDWNRP